MSSRWIAAWSRVPSAMVDKPAPDFDLPAVTGLEIPGLKTADLNGDVMLVNFFASWCIPCLSEHRYVTALAEETSVPVFGVNLRDDPEQAFRWLSDLGDPYAKFGADSDGAVSRRLGVGGIPVTMVVDGTGHIRYRHDGPITERLLRSEVIPVIDALRAQPHL